MMPSEQAFVFGQALRMPKFERFEAYSFSFARSLIFAKRENSTCCGGSSVILLDRASSGLKADKRSVSEPSAEA